MTELVVHEPGALAHTSDDATASLIAWAKAASAADQLAESLTRTSFIPAHFAGKQGDAAAAIMYGAEAGLSPLQALQGIYVIGGKPAMYARTLMAVAMSQGHEVWTETITPTSVTVCGRRRGTKHVETSEWTYARAERAGYTRNAKYKTDLTSMLLARGQSDICRRIAPDALLGMPYSVEELEDAEPEQTTTTKRAPAKPTTARRAQTPDPKEPPLEEPPHQPAPEEPADDEITAKQITMMGTLMTKHGLTDRADALDFIETHTGRAVKSRKELTKVEASKVLDALVQIDGGEPGELFDTEEPEL